MTKANNAKSDWNFLNESITRKKTSLHKITVWTYCSPGSGPPLVVCWGHIPAAVAGMASWILRISVRLVVDALAMVGAGCNVTLLFCCRLLVWVTERLSHRLVVVGADHLSSESSHATSHWTLGQKGRDHGVKNWGDGEAVNFTRKQWFTPFKSNLILK